MKWRQVHNSIRVQQVGEYNDWKEQISEDCHHLCVYCSIHEAPWGGIDHYQIDHFRPKSKFTELTHIITNLYYCCPICNKFKGSDWKGYTNNLVNLEEFCYPDPGEYDYNTIFDLHESNFTLSGKNKAAKYVVNRLYLNRPQLIYERRESSLKQKAESLILTVNELVDLCNDQNLVKEAFQALASLTDLLLKRSEIRPYRLVEIRKSK